MDFSESSVRAFAHAAAIAPIDFSPSALQALGFALDLARQADGRVTLLHVVEWLAEEEPRASTHFSVPEYRRYMVEDAQERLRNLVAEEPRTWVEIDDLVVFGRAHREILRAAETKPADLIVMGAQGSGGIGLATVWLDDAAGSLWCDVSCPHGARVAADVSRRPLFWMSGTQLPKDLRRAFTPL